MSESVLDGEGGRGERPWDWLDNKGISAWKGQLKYSTLKKKRTGKTFFLIVEYDLRIHVYLQEFLSSLNHPPAINNPFV